MWLRPAAMAYLPLFLLLALLPCAEGRIPRIQASNQTAQVMRKAHLRGTPTPPPYLRLPVFLDSKLPLVEKEYFSPQRSSGAEPLPERVREILLPIRPKSAPAGVSGVSVKTSCKRTKMQVQVERSLLEAGETHAHLKLGMCTASKSTKHRLYFDFGLGTCGTERAMIDNQVVYSNTLRYEPPTLQGPIRRAVAFSLPVACYFNRYQYAYKVGYAPKVPIRKIFKQMKNGASFSLTPRNAEWERLSPSDQYVLGKPMYFQAEALPVSHHERLYIHSCYASPEESHTSTLRFPVVKNFGCMVESKGGRSRFIPYKNNAVRFSVDAFLFKGIMGKQLYMHCVMAAGSSVPAPTAKSCNYDATARRWVELYGSDSVCTCCDSNCTSAASTETQIISSRAWTVEPKGETFRTQKKKKNMVSTETTAAPQSARPGWRTQPVVAAVPPVEEVKEEWPFGGGGVMWTEEGEEKQVKGSASVEEVTTEPRRIFEEIFDFDQ